MKRSALVALGSIALAGCIADDSRSEEKTADAVQPIESLITPSKPNATRFLEQSSFGPNTKNVSHVMSVGITEAITEQLAAGTALYDTDADAPDIGAQFFFHAMTKSDQLRQRTAFALSQILVVSQLRFAGLTDKGKLAMGGYLNTLKKDAFGNFKTVLFDLTVNPAMGRYLDMVNNNAFSTTSVALAPNENYAREVLQLFTLGLNLLNDDGTLKLDADGQPQEAYTQAQVENLAHVLTGWTYGGAACPTIGHSNPANYAVPMIPCDVNHDTGSHELFNGFSTTPGLGALAHTNEAVESIFNHPNLPPFISKQLIQHLVTSNPTPEYVLRVVKKFKNDGVGVRGNMAVVLRTILEDPEARGPVPPLAVQAQYGHLRSPVLLITNVLRWTKATVTLNNPVLPPPPAGSPAVPADGAVQLNNYSNTMRQYVPRPSSVFSYYPPDAPLPGSPDLVGPEFGITDTSTAFARSNFLNAAFIRTIPNVTIDWTVLPTEPGALVQWLDDNLMHDTMSSQLKSIVLDSITNPTVPVASQQALAIYLVAVSPEYQVQH